MKVAANVERVTHLEPTSLREAIGLPAESEEEEKPEAKREFRNFYPVFSTAATEPPRAFSANVSENQDRDTL